MALQDKEVYKINPKLMVISSKKSYAYIN